MFSVQHTRSFHSHLQTGSQQDKPCYLCATKIPSKIRLTICRGGNTTAGHHTAAACSLMYVCYVNCTAATRSVNVTCSRQTKGRAPPFRKLPLRDIVLCFFNSLCCLAAGRGRVGGRSSAWRATVAGVSLPWRDDSGTTRPMSIGDSPAELCVRSVCKTHRLPRSNAYI